MLPPVCHAGLRHDGGRSGAVHVPGVRQGALQGEVRRLRHGGAQRRAEDRRPRHRQVPRPQPARGDLHQGAADHERYGAEHIPCLPWSPARSNEPPNVDFSNHLNDELAHRSPEL